MNAVLRHIMVPAVAPSLIVILYFTPTTLFDCLTRGLLAVGVAGVAAIAAFAAIGKGFFRAQRGRPDAPLWVLSAAVLVVPLALLLGPLG